MSNSMEELNNQNNTVTSNNSSSSTAMNGAPPPPPAAAAVAAVGMDNNTISSNSEVIRQDEDSDVEMDTTEETQNGHTTAPGAVVNSSNGKVSPTTNGYQNGNTPHTRDCHNFQKEDEEMGMYYYVCAYIWLYICVYIDIDVPVIRKTCGKPAVERILEFGRELYNMSQRLKVEQGKNEVNKKMLQVNKSVMHNNNNGGS